MQKIYVILKRGNLSHHFKNKIRKEGGDISKRSKWHPDLYAEEVNNIPLLRDVEEKSFNVKGM